MLYISSPRIHPRLQRSEDEDDHPDLEESRTLEVAMELTSTTGGEVLFARLRGREEMRREWPLLVYVSCPHDEGISEAKSEVA